MTRKRHSKKSRSGPAPELRGRRRAEREPVSLPCGPRTEPEPLCRAVAWVVRKLRERRDWSLGQLARVAGLRRQTIGYVESLQRVPTLDTLVRISHALGRELHALLKLAGRALLRWSRWGGPGWQQ